MHPYEGSVAMLMVKIREVLSIRTLSFLYLMPLFPILVGAIIKSMRMTKHPLGNPLDKVDQKPKEYRPCPGLVAVLTPEGGCFS